MRRAGSLYDGEFTSLVTSWQGFIGLVWSVVFLFVLFFVDTLSLFCILTIFYCCIFAFPYTKVVLHRFEDPRPLDPFGVASPHLGMQNNLRSYHVYDIL